MTGGRFFLLHGNISASWRTRLLVHAENHRRVRRVQIQTDDVDQLCSNRLSFDSLTPLLGTCKYSFARAREVIRT